MRETLIQISPYSGPCVTHFALKFKFKLVFKTSLWQNTFYSIFKQYPEYVKKFFFLFFQNGKGINYLYKIL